MDDGTRIGGRANRVLAMLAIVMGVLAMHGLVGGHHGTVPIVAAATASDATGPPADHTAGRLHTIQHGMLGAAATATTPVHDLPGGCDGECSEHPSGLLLLCVAVLLAAGVALAPGLASRTWRTAPAIGPPGRRLLTTAPARRFDLVADLCISRT